MEKEETIGFKIFINVKSFFNVQNNTKKKNNIN